MSLPKWIEDIKNRSSDCSEADELLQAVLIAWDALKKGRLYDGPVQAIHRLNGNAMRRIEEIGK